MRVIYSRAVNPRRASLVVTLSLLSAPLASFAQQAHSEPPASATPASQVAPAAQPPTTAPAVTGRQIPETPAAQVGAPAPSDLPPPPPGAPITTQPTQPPATPATQAGPRIAVIDAAPIGVDGAAGTYVTNVLRTSIAELGFTVIPTPELHDAARRIALPFPVPPDGMITLERALQAPVAATAEVRAAQGLYVVRLRVRVAVEGTEREREVSATQFQLADAIRSALPALLVPPSANAQPATQPSEPPQSGGALTGSIVGGGPATGPDEGSQQAPRRRRVRAHPRRWELAVGPILALGPGKDAFVNFLGMVRASWFPTDRVGISASLSYANLNGRNERVSNILTTIGIETAVDLVPSSRIFIPLRAEVGYLPLNGPVFRLTAGVSFQLARRVRLEVDVLSPSLWVLAEGSPVSLDLGALVSFGL